MNPAQHLALQLATAGPLRLPEPYLPPHITEGLPRPLIDEILVAMRADNEDNAGTAAILILGAVLDATSKTGNGSAILAQVLDAKCLVKGTGGAGVSRQAISKRAIAIRRALGFPALAVPNNARPKKAKTAANN
jgi:hypothetical protein